MSLLIVVTDVEMIRPLLTSAWAIVNARQRELTILCWTEAATVMYPLLADQGELTENEALVRESRQVLNDLARVADGDCDPEMVTFRRALGPDVTDATLAEIRSRRHGMVIVDASHESAASAGEAPQIHPLLRRSPCDTILFLRTSDAQIDGARILVVANDSRNDQAAFGALSHHSRSATSKLTFARIEDEAGEEASELGRLELGRLMRAGGVKEHEGIRRRVYSRDSRLQLLKTAEKNQLVLIGANQAALLDALLQGTRTPAIAVIKKAPPLRRLGRVGSRRWKTKLNPADYADMMQSLRCGSELNADFLVMLGLAAGIASLGLLQDSPAVVIGSMLLAPLMTPMIACGLAIAQANKKLGRRSMLSIAVGFLLTLAVSFLVGIAAPGEEISSEVVSRGNPNILDLLVALLSAAAAAYALARPSIVGAIAGVAIATALVPPLCSAGISLAYGEYLNAHGAALLFATNLVAIILGAAAMFRLLGVTSATADTAQRRWVYRISTAICLALIVLAYPLQRRLNQRIDQGHTQPRTYPLTKVTDDALVDFIELTAEIELVTSGRPSTKDGHADVVLVLSSREPLAPEFVDELIRICQDKMEDPELAVEVHCFLNALQDDER